IEGSRLDADRGSMLRAAGHFGLVASAIAAHVGRGNAIAGFSEDRDLMAPGVPTLRPTVHEQHERPLAGQRHPQVDAVSRDGFEVRPCHDTCSLRRTITSMRPRTNKPRLT